MNLTLWLEVFYIAGVFERNVTLHTDSLNAGTL